MCIFAIMFTKAISTVNLIENDFEEFPSGEQAFQNHIQSKKQLE